ncbi:MAG TPA: STAS domain-containing protein [Vicinamibacterales bacterium]|nr:STAS domain-containing protein [Vicinamibacterales bacterium]
MNIAQRAAGNVMIVDVNGQIKLGDGDILLRDKLQSLIQQGHKQLVLNLAGVNYIDSSGLGEIAHAYVTVSRQGGQLKLAGLTKRLKDLLTITKLLTVFESFDTDAEAVDSFAP